MRNTVFLKSEKLSNTKKTPPKKHPNLLICFPEAFLYSGIASPSFRCNRNMIEVKVVFKAPQSKCKQRKFSNLRRNSKIPQRKEHPIQKILFLEANFLTIPGVEEVQEASDGTIRKWSVTMAISMCNKAFAASPRKQETFAHNYKNAVTQMKKTHQILSL
jgi:hypothetical protein